jgi:hypothetical protein
MKVEAHAQTDLMPEGAMRRIQEMRLFMSQGGVVNSVPLVA